MLLCTCRPSKFSEFGKFDFFSLPIFCAVLKAHPTVAPHHEGNLRTHGKIFM